MFCEICHHLVRFCEILWDILRYSEIWWDTDILWDMARFCDIWLVSVIWDLIRFCEIWWDWMRFGKILWNKVRFGAVGFVRVGAIWCDLRVKPTNSMSGHKNLQNVAVCWEHLFCSSLNTAPIIFNITHTEAPLLTDHLGTQGRSSDDQGFRMVGVSGVGEPIPFKRN